ncbi:MAG: TonB-dependent receptor [Lysobacterales bacterium]
MRKLPQPFTGGHLKSNKKPSSIIVLLLSLFALLAGPLYAAGETVDVDIAALPAKSAFETFRVQTGITLEWSNADVAGFTSKTVNGNMGVSEALQIMLGDSGLQATQLDAYTFVIHSESANPRVTQLSQAAAETDEQVLEEVVVTGTQIKGAAISEALSVSVISSEDIAAFGITSGDQLLQTMTEQGQNFQSESESISGGVNSVRGDIGAFNLRNMGTGNTLVLLNGRRMVQAAGYQTEEVGGSFVPVNTVNSNEIPVLGVRRVEVLRDGASAIYGADAVAGVVNTVLKTNFEGLNVQVRYDWYDNIPRNDIRANVEWGHDFNDGRTNVSLFADFYHRDRVNSQDDPKWANSDMRYLLPDDSPWLVNPVTGAAVTTFRNDAIDSSFGQFDMAGSYAGVTDSAGEFETWPIGDPNCQLPQAWVINDVMCGLPDGTGRLPDGLAGPYRYNSNTNRDLYSDLDRYNVFFFLNHEFENGTEAYTEVSYYRAETSLYRQPSTMTTGVELEVGANNYYNPFGPLGSANRLSADIIGDKYPEGRALLLDYFSWTEVNRAVDNTATTWRVLQGFRGAWGEWDWDGAVVWSEAKREDITRGRISNTLMQEALNDPTPAAYNPFSGGNYATSNIERALVDVYRINKTDLKMADFKVSKNDLFNLPAGPVGFLAGAEWREESFSDNRDPRLDGTITFTNLSGETYPFISDVMNSSPSGDSSGSRKTTSLFAEFAVPVFSTLDMQFAARYEHASDYGSYTVPKVAFGWRLFEPLLIRGSWSKAFRAPNLITVNEDLVVRTNTITNQVCSYGEDYGGEGAMDELVCSGGVQRRAEGNQNLDPEKSTNTSIGAVWTPLDDLMITLDFWSIKKKDTIGLFGETNATLLDLLLRIEHGPVGCDTFIGNPAIGYGPVDPEDVPYYLAAGICPIGQTEYVEDGYQNLDTRTVKGHDIGVYYALDTAWGSWDFTARGTFYDKYEQQAGGAAALLLQASNEGILPVGYYPGGFADLMRLDGNQSNKYNFSLSWQKDAWGANLSAFYLSSFIWTSSDLTPGVNCIDLCRWVVPSMTTYNFNVDYRFDMWKSDTRVRLGINNFTNERAPLADRYFAYVGDAHSDLGRYFYVSLRMGF